MVMSHDGWMEPPCPVVECLWIPAAGIGGERAAAFTPCLRAFLGAFGWPRWDTACWTFLGLIQQGSSQSLVSSSLAPGKAAFAGGPIS